MRTKLFILCVLIGLLSSCTGSALAARGHAFQTAFGSEGVGNGQFRDPVGVAVNEATGEVYVVDQGEEIVLKEVEKQNKEKYTVEEPVYHGRVERFALNTATGKYEYTGQFPTNGGRPGEQRLPPSQIVIDNTCKQQELKTDKALTAGECKALDPSNGDVYVVDRKHKTIASSGLENEEGEYLVDKFTPEGGYLDQINSETVRAASRLPFEIKGITVGPRGELFALSDYVTGLTEEQEKTIKENSDREVEESAEEKNWKTEEEGGKITKKEFEEKVERSVMSKIEAAENEIIKARSLSYHLDGFNGTGTPEHVSSKTLQLEVGNLSGLGLAVGANGDFYTPYFNVGHLNTGGESAYYRFLEFDASGDVLDYFDKYISESGSEEYAVNGLATELPNRAVYGSGDGVYVDRIDGIQEWAPGESSETGPVAEFGDGELSCLLVLMGNCNGALAVDSVTGQVFAGEGTSNEVRVYGWESANAPTVSGESVTSVTDDSAKIVGEVTPRSIPGEAATEYWIEYGVCASLTMCATSKTTPAESFAPSFESEGVGPVDLEGLTARTQYHYRLVAQNEHGETYGREGTFTTYGTGAFQLPDGREWEMVSPPDKLGALIEPIGESWLIEAAADGGGLVYVANAPTEPSPAGYDLYQWVLASRGGGGGWSSRDLSIPHAAPTQVSIGVGWDYRFFSEDLSRAVVQPPGPFTPCHSADKAPQPCISPEASEQTAFAEDLYAGGGDSGEACAASCFTPMVTGKKNYANVSAETVFGETSTEGGVCPTDQFCGPRFIDGTPDARHAVLQSPASLTEESAPPNSLYEWSEGVPASEQLRLVSVLPGNAQGQALPAAQGAGLGYNHGNNSRHAISDDGERIVWEDGGYLYLRENATAPQSPIEVGTGRCMVASDACTVQLDAGLSTGNRSVFQTANSEVTRIIFTNGPSSDEGKRDLYEYDVGKGRSQLTNDAEVVNLVVGMGEDGNGSWLYFTANGALAEGAVAGNCPPGNETPAERCNLYAIHFDGAVWEAPKLVAVLSGADLTDWAHELDLTYLAARVSPNGEWLAFMSQRSLTGYDNSDAETGEPDQEVYEYDAATGTLVCASCNPTEARPHGLPAVQLETAHDGLAGGDNVFQGWLAANLPPWTPSLSSSISLYQSRYLDDSGRLFFDSSDQLVPKDTNKTEDVYEYEPEGVPAGEHGCSSESQSGSVVFKSMREMEVEGRKVREGAGCVGLISSGESPQQSAFLDASENGSEVFFLTSAKLSRQDIDTARDVYDARECTTASPCATPAVEGVEACDEESSCRPAPSPQPEIYGPSGSATFSGPGDLVAPLPGAVVPKPVAKSLTRTQKLARALKACKRDRSKNKRAACERQARRQYAAKAGKARAGRAGAERGAGR